MGNINFIVGKKKLKVTPRKKSPRRASSCSFLAPPRMVSTQDRRLTLDHIVCAALQERCGRAGQPDGVRGAAHFGKQEAAASAIGAQAHREVRD